MGHSTGEASGARFGSLSVAVVFLGLAAFPALYWRARRRREHEDVLMRTFGPVGENG